MMEYKSGSGYSGKGYIDPKRQGRSTLLLTVILLSVVFSLTAFLFGWWSIFVDFGFIAYLIWLGKRAANKLDRG